MQKQLKRQDSHLATLFTSNNEKKSNNHKTNITIHTSALLLQNIWIVE